MGPCTQGERVPPRLDFTRPLPGVKKRLQASGKTPPATFHPSGTHSLDSRLPRDHRG